MTVYETYCLQLLRSRAYELYFSILFAPAAKRGALAALYAFQVEILHIGEQVREPLLGEMRLQWWCENLIACVKKYEQATEIKLENAHEKKQNKIPAGMEEQSPVLTALAAAINHYNLPLAPFLCFCETAHFDLYHDIMPHRTALEEYYENLYGAILRLACKILREEENEVCDRACGHGGLAQGLAALIRHLPRTIKQGKFYIPADILASAGADRQGLEIGITGQESGENSAEVFKKALNMRKRIAAIIFAYFYEHYKAFIKAQKPLSAGFRPAFLPLAILPAFVKQAEKQQETVFTAPLIMSPLVKQMRISRAAFLNRF